MNYRFRTLVVFFFAALPFLSIAQKDVNAAHDASTNHQHTAWCASEYSEEQLQALEEFADYYYHRGGKEEMEARPRATIYAPIAYHIVANTDGSNSYGLTKAIDELCTLNQDMEHTDIQFYLKHEIDLSIKRDAFNTGVSSGSATPTQLSLMVPINNKTDAINVYQVTRIRDDGGVAGFAYGSVFHNNGAPNPSSSAVFLKKGSGGEGETAAHEFGHNFSLPHTFFGWEGQADYVCGSKAPSWAEKYNGSNCTTSGDRFCDTDPDYVAGWNCSGNDTLNTACLQMDADSATGYANGTNIMSYAFQCTHRKFSTAQIAAMTYHLNNLRSNQLGLGVVPNTAIITAQASLTSPIVNSSSPYDATTFQWTAVPNATHYSIEINRLPTFPDGQTMIDMAVIANGTTYTSTKLDPNTTYHWRIRAFNEGYFCTNTSPKKTFTTSDYAASTNNTITSVEQVDLMPNPIHSGQPTNLVIKSDKVFDAGINVYAINGKLVASEQKEISSGTTVHTIDTNGLSAGIYIVSVQSENGVINKKLVITE